MQEHWGKDLQLLQLNSVPAKPGGAGQEREVGARTGKMNGRNGELPHAIAQWEVLFGRHHASDRRERAKRKPARSNGSTGPARWIQLCRASRQRLTRPEHAAGELSSPR
jgi:hypothetical protein